MPQLRNVPARRHHAGERSLQATLNRSGETMEMKRMNGGGLRAAGYDERSRKLVVELTSGTLEYSGVPGEVWRRFSTASSPWSYYRDNIEEEYPAHRTR
jgi:KTSC domain